MLNLLVLLSITSEEVEKVETFIQTFLREAGEMGLSVLKAIIVFSIGKIVINLLNNLFRRILTRRKIDPSAKSFLSSLVNITLTVLLIISVVGALGVQTTSIAALLASAGVTIGMALSGNLSNFAGGVVILLFKPFKVGDYIEGQGIGGTVQEIQIFHTILNTSDNKQVYIPNGALSSGIVTNYNSLTTRRVEWTFHTVYGEDYERVRLTIEEVMKQDYRILLVPEPLIALSALADNKVSVVVRAWVLRDDFWAVFYELNRKVYEAFKEKGIDFPSQQTIIQMPGK